MKIRDREHLSVNLAHPVDRQAQAAVRLATVPDHAAFHTSDSEGREVPAEAVVIEVETAVMTVTEDEADPFPLQNIVNSVTLVTARWDKITIHNLLSHQKH